jgi:hypothetical protein
MALFVAIHQHTPTRCPAADAGSAQALLAHLSPDNASRYGVKLHAEAVADNEHVLYLIAEASDEAQLRRYLAPFARQGGIEVLPASSCRAVIARSSCGNPDSVASIAGRAGRHRLEV